MDEEDNQEEKSWEDYLYNYWYLWIAIAAIVLFQGKYGTVVYDKVSFFAVGFVVVVLLFKGLDNEMKIRTPKAIANDMSTTIDGKWQPVGVYGMIRAGAIDAHGLHIQGRDGTWIAPLTAFNPRGRNLDISCHLVRISKDELPPDVKEEVDRGDWPEPFYFGLTDTVENVNLPDLSFLESYIRQMHKSHNFLSDVLNNKLDVVEGQVQYATRLTDILKSSRIDTLKKALLRNEEE